jgi:hypothetical protein
MYKYNINLYISAYINICIKYYITMLSHILLYYIYPCHIHGQGGGIDMNQLIPHCLLRVSSGSQFWSFGVLK